MVQPTAAELMEIINTWATWLLRHGDVVLRLPVYITDAKNSYGSTRFKCVIERQTVWLDETSLEWAKDETE